MFNGKGSALQTTHQIWKIIGIITLVWKLGGTLATVAPLLHNQKADLDMGNIMIKRTGCCMSTILSWVHS